MAPDDVAILMSAYHSFKNDIKEMLKASKEEHDTRADERHKDTINNIQLLAQAQKVTADEVVKIKIHCAERKSKCDTYEEHVKKSDKEKQLKETNDKWKIATIGGWALAITAIVAKVVWK